MSLCYSKIEKCNFSYYHQCTSFFHLSRRYVFVRENGWEPKNQLYAEKGDGCGLVIIWCFDESIRVFLDIAKLPQRINTIHSHLSDRRWITLSVNISHHFPPWEAGTPERTVKTAFKRRTPSCAQSERSVFSRLIQISLSSSLNILRRLGCALDHSGTENESHIAAHIGCSCNFSHSSEGWNILNSHFILAGIYAVWYGSWPRMTTFTVSNGVESNARNICFPSGKHCSCEYSRLTKSVNSCQYGFSNSDERTASHDGWIFTIKNNYTTSIVIFWNQQWKNLSQIFR